MRYEKVIWWIKRDMRLSDNQALMTALEQSQQVIPVFIFETDIINADDYSPMHLFAQISALYELQAKLKNAHADVLILKGDAIELLNQLFQKWPFQAIYAHQETGNALTYSRDLAVEKMCRKHRIDFNECYQTGVIRRLQNRKNRQIFIRERLLTRSLLPSPEKVRVPIDEVAQLNESLGIQIPVVTDFFSQKDCENIQFENMQTINESSAHATLKSFLLTRGVGYSGGISSPNTAFQHGSRLSAHLAWGTLSLCQAYSATAQKLDDLKSLKSPQAKQWRRSLNAFRSRLHWHCHFIQRLETEPRMEFHALNPAYEFVDYENDTQLLKAWQQGKTGFPLVDACMRCLNAIGFLNFRMRAFIVSFAIFGLHLDWRTIHPYLARVFYDYEPGIHLSQLQMQAGIVGINTIRVYNPTKQLIDQDPNSLFVKQWIPELKDCYSVDIQSYETIPLPSYPRTIVDFQSRSKAMKDQIFAIRKSQKAKVESAKVMSTHGSRKSKKVVKKSQKESTQLNLF